jgi:hypothetical protein
MAVSKSMIVLFCFLVSFSMGFLPVWTPLL